MTQTAVKALDELKQSPQWVVWKYEERDGKATKPPYSAKTGHYASSTDNSTWGTYQQAISAYKRGGYEGVGYSLLQGSGLVGGDLDACIGEDGKIAQWAMDIVERVQSYTEISPGGAGLRFIARGSLPGALKQDLTGKVERLDGIDKAPGIEMYESGRYLTITGNHLAGTPDTIEERSNELLAIYNQYKKKPAPKQSRKPAPTPLDLSDQELLQKMFASKLGPDIQALWNGTHGMEDESRADYNLLSHLAFWTGKDANRMEALFDQSALGSREKWQERTDYRQRTIDAAINACSEVYDPKSRQEIAGNEQIDPSPVRKAIAEKDAKALLKTAHILAQMSRDDYAIIKMDIKGALPKLSLRDLDAAVNEKRKAATAHDEDIEIDLDDVAQAFANRYSDHWAYDAERATWRQWVGTHWQEPYSDESGKYEIDTIVVNLLHEFAIEVKSNGTLDCVHRLARGKCSQRFETTPDLVNFRNGTLHIVSMKIIPHCKDDHLLYCLDYDYAPGDHPNITSIIAETLCVIDEEKGTRTPDFHAAQAYMMHLGLALIGDTSMHNFCILYGAKRAGKSTMLRLGNAVCGHTISNCADFAGDSLFSTELEGKRVRYSRNKQRLVCADEVSPDALRNEGIVKDMTAHSGVEMRGMNKDEEKGNQWRPKLLLSTNDMPRYKDMASAMKERVIFLQAPYTRPKEDRNPRHFEDCLLPELGAFAHTCIVLAKLVLERWYYPQSSHMKKLANIAETNGNALKAFIEEYCVLEKDAKIPTGQLFDKFKTYREDNGHSKNYSKLTMVADLKDMRVGVYPCEKTERYDGKPQRLLHGIRCRHEDEEYNGIHHSLNDDTLLIPICNDRNDSVTMFLGIVTPSQVAPQADSQTPCNDVTINSEKFPTREQLNNARERDVKYISHPIANYTSQKSVTSLHSPVHEPVAPSETRNDSHKKALQESLHPQTAREFKPGDRVNTPEGPATVRFQSDGRYCVHVDKYDPRVGSSRGFSVHEMTLLDEVSR